jgi:hypothetical protein
MTGVFNNNSVGANRCCVVEMWMRHKKNQEQTTVLYPT